MHNRRFLLPMMIAVGLALPLVAVSVYTMSFAQEPPRVELLPPAPNRFSPDTFRPVIRIAQNNERAGNGAVKLDQYDIPGGAAVDDRCMKFKSTGIGSCGVCHNKQAAQGTVDIKSKVPPAFRGSVASDDGWALLSEGNIWGFLDKHVGSYAVLLNSRSQQMGKLLNVVDDNGNSIVHRDQRCLACHVGLPLYEMEVEKDRPGIITEKMAKEDGRLHVGVSCEGCHGAADAVAGDVKGWKELHYNKTWRYMDPAKKADLHNYYDVRSPVSKTRMCLSCHLGNAKEGRVVTHEMYAAGHPPLPGFEVSTFIDQEPQHWRSFKNKPESIRNEFLENTKDWRKRDWSKDELPETREMLVGAIVNLSETLKLNADLIDSDLAFPVKSNHWPDKQAEGSWPELANFACYACHHDLRDQGWRIQRKPIGVPGRPLLHEWPFVLVKVAIRHSADAEAKRLLNAIKEYQLASVKKPFGDQSALQMQGRMLASQLDVLAHQVEQTNLSKDDGSKVLEAIFEIARSEQLDYDSARQLVWAARVVYADTQGTAPKLTDFYGKSEFADVPGWFSKDADLNPVNKSFKEFGDELLLDLRKGRVKTGKVADDFDLPYLEWQAELALPQIGSYNPSSFQKRITALEELLSTK